MNILSLIGREKELFTEDIFKHDKELTEIVGSSRFLVIGGAGSIGQAVTKEIFKRNPQKLHVADISENNLVELVRDIRSSFGYINGDFQTFALDIGSPEYDAFWNVDGNYDYVLNLSALKHVRSEKDPDRKRRKQAEFLVQSEIPLSAIVAFVVYNTYAKSSVLAKFAEHNYTGNILDKPKWYY